jgi:hypothetical protein
MENKKLLGYILKDLIALEEVLGDQTSLQLDEIETEFVQNRVKSARKLVQMFMNHPEEQALTINQEIRNDVGKKEVQAPAATVVVPEKPVEKQSEAVIIEKPVQAVADGKLPFQPEEPVVESTVDQKPVSGVLVNEILGFLEETITEIAEEEGVALPAADDEDDWKEEPPVKTEPVKAEPVQQELELDEDSAHDRQNKRLGDSFSKEKSLNDLNSGEAQKLENKISNMPVASIQAAIGINDRFQYIRELFDGSSEKYVETVTKLDSMTELKDAVVYLQQNFKWKKTEVSLKFVSLIKRRFPQ